ncbi:Fic family protein [Legionella jamestowniensis]|uniref:Ankyrin repeat-containing protein n=1 Tax=Legionella jamestowniensis TaxID=455 RepID=A0A0W0UGX3_9GAMM|nr:Fic family protein [Legionella jamestowniensis]KTD06919.1 ankyrin repeat-containing protein [Legionella jamestowniensis]OCH97442.1 hypothetical protein A8135_02920 [Legionella jamestowniensis]SFL85118.1 Fic/DOC family protein [Legionella jamestowniensis DSM 19215]
MLSEPIDIEEVFAGLPNDDFWKLIMDWEHWELNDPLLFDKQSSPGYLKNASRALLFLLETINEPVTLEFIIQLHDIAYHENNDDYLGLKPFGSSGLAADAVSLEGIRELLAKVKHRPKKDLSLCYYKDGDSNTIYKIDAESISAEEILMNLETGFWDQLLIDRRSSIQDVVLEVNALLAQFHVSLSEAQTEQNQLESITTLIRELHQYHPFNDGNGRTFIFLLLNKLLIMNALSPSTVEKPERFSGYSIQELVEEIEKGQVNFRDICTQPEEKTISLQQYLKNKIANYSLPDKSNVGELGIFSTEKPKFKNNASPESHNKKI